MSEEKRDLKLDVACDPLAPSTIRRALAEEANVGEKLGDVMLVASELVTNAVQHSGAAQQERLEVEIEIAPGRLRFSVSDPGTSGLTAEPTTKLPPSGGLGLRVVEEISQRWGSERARSGRHRVWAELALS